MASLEQAQGLLAELIDGARAEGDAAGYQRGRADVLRELSAFLQAQSATTASALDLLKATPASAMGTMTMPQGWFRASDQSEGGRRRRGKNAEEVMAVLSLSEEAMGATDIQRRISKTTPIAYSSVRNALKQLLGEGKVIERTGGIFEAKTAPSDTEEAA